MSTSPEIKFLSTPRPFTRQLAGLFYGCRVELMALAGALVLAALGRGAVQGMSEWDANGVVMLIGALWMALCVLIYRFLAR